MLIALSIAPNCATDDVTGLQEAASAAEEEVGQPPPFAAAVAVALKRFGEARVAHAASIQLRTVTQPTHASAIESGRRLTRLAAAPAPNDSAWNGFVVVLGRDTVQVERYRRMGNHLAGTVAYRSPASRIVRYTALLAPDGQFTRYEQRIFTPNGVPIERNNGNATLLYASDTVTRQTVSRTGEPATTVVGAPNGASPLIGASLLIPFAYSYVTYELAFERARRRQPSGETRWLLVGPGGGAAIQSARVWHIGADSAEWDYFGVARAGFRFDTAGRLVRSDWTATTYKYLVSRDAATDPDTIARRWAAEEAIGKGIGVYSPRDTTRVIFGSANLWIDYSRPARRARTVWGGVVPFGKVWRLGADYATQFSTDLDLLVGEVRIPAGKYSLWLLPEAAGAQLIVNRQTGQFGTNYDPRQDLVRIPMRRRELAEQFERLTIGVADGELRVSWGNASYAVSIRLP